MTRKELPEYDRCVEIVTAAAQKELLGPGMVAVATPVLVAFGLGAAACGGYLCGAILTGQLLAVYSGFENMIASSIWNAHTFSV